jgi:hypothetical protein
VQINHLTEEPVMTQTTRPVDLSTTSDRSTIALVLAVLSVPGSLLTWDVLPGQGFVWGGIPAVAAIVLAVPALRSSRGKAIAALVIAGAMIAMMVVWTLASLG